MVRESPSNAMLVAAALKCRECGSQHLRTIENASQDDDATCTGCGTTFTIQALVEDAHQTGINEARKQALFNLLHVMQQAQEY